MRQRIDVDQTNGLTIVYACDRTDRRIFTSTFDCMEDLCDFCVEEEVDPSECVIFVGRPKALGLKPSFAITELEDGDEDEDEDEEEDEEEDGNETVMVF